MLISCKTLQSTETNPHIRQDILLPVRWVIVGRYGLRLEAEYAFRRNAIRKIDFYAEGSSKHGHFQTSSYMANLLWDLPLSSWGCAFWNIQPFIGAGIGYDFQQMHSSNSRIVFNQNGTFFLASDGWVSLSDLLQYRDDFGIQIPSGRLSFL